jgi:DNA-binding beta-propeller fold protein YncE
MGCFPSGIHAAKGQVLVSGAARNTIQVFNPSGTLLTTFGSAGSGDGQFAWPYGITKYQRRIFIADLGNNRIQVFSELHIDWLPIMGIG